MLVLLLLGVLLAFWLQEVIYKKYWHKNLIVHTEFVDSYVYEGDLSYLREEISNDKKLPLPALEVRLAINRNLIFSNEAKQNANITDQSYRRDIFSLLFHQKVIHTLPFLCARRGYYQIRDVEVVGYDLFFDGKYYLNAAQHTGFYVYPSQTDTRRIRLLCRTVSGMILVQSRLYPDPFEFSGIREYRPADPMHHINWKASARSTSLMVNQFDSTTNIRTTVILDVEDAGILRYESLTEESIRIASSFAARMVKEQMELDLISNAVYEDPSEASREEPASSEGQAHWRALSWHLKPGAGHIGELNRKLACIDTTQNFSGIDSLLQKEITQKRTGHIYVLISKNQREDILARLHTLASGGNEILWVVPMRPEMKLAYKNSPGIHFMRWEAA